MPNNVGVPLAQLRDEVARPLNANMCLLRHLRSGDSAVVEEICGNHDECEVLARMGVRCGDLIRMISPGSPCAIQVGESRLMLRGQHAEAIRVSTLL